MEINPNLNLGAISSLASTRNMATPAGQSGDSDTFISTNLEGALQNTPDIRPEALAHGLSLAGSSDYPSGDTIKSLSNFLASRLSAGLDGVNPP
jgi:hypothetical protein